MFTGHARNLGVLGFAAQSWFALAQTPDTARLVDVFFRDQYSDSTEKAMNQTAAVWLLIALAFVAANLPFLNDRVFAVWQAKALLSQKSFWLRMLELFVLYLLVGGIGIAFEGLLGNVFKQRWEFYTITFSLFVVMAFPGFVFRYLLRRA